MFTQVVPGASSTTATVRRISFWRTLRLCSRVPVTEPSGIDQSQLYNIKDLAQEAKKNGWGPVAVFPEASLRMQINTKCLS